MKFTLEIELGNDAMQRYSEIRGAIGNALKPERRNHCVLKLGKVTSGDGGAISDINGNTVGKWEVVDEAACAVCGVHALDHGHYDATDPQTHKWVSPCRY